MALLADNASGAYIYSYKILVMAKILIISSKGVFF